MPLRVVLCRSNPIAPDPRVEKEARALLKAGYAITLVGWDRTARLEERQEIDGIPVHRLPVRAGFARGIFNLPALLRWQVRLMSWLIRSRGDYDVIHACDFDTVLPAMVCKKLLGKKVIYDIFDFYADHLRATPSLVKRMIRGVDLMVVSQVDGVILADESRRLQIDGARPKALEVIYNSPQDLLGVFRSENRESWSHFVGHAKRGTKEFIRVNPRKSASHQKRIKGELRLAYVGLLQVERGLLQLLEVLSRRPEWGLDLAGFGGDEEKIVSLARSLPNVNFHGRIPYDLALELSSRADTLLATYDPAIPNHRFSSPNKVFEAMMLGKPIVVARGTNMDRLIEDNRCGIVVEYGDPAALESALDRLAQNPGLRAQLGESGRRAYETSYHWSIMESRLLGLYAKVCEDR